jgi:RNA polymerase sigma-70 factor (ECF subfamily)
LKLFAYLKRSIVWNVKMKNKNPQVTDNDLSAIQQCLSGNPEAFEELVIRYQKPVYNLVYRYLGNAEDAKDITQEAFVKAYQSLAKHNPELAFHSWLFRIAQNLSIDYLRWKKRRITFSIDETIEDVDRDRQQKEIVDQTPDVRSRLIEEQKCDRIQSVINSLPEQYKSVIILRHIEGLRLEEIAQVLKLPLGTIKTNLYRARNLMKDKLGDTYDAT